MRRTGSVRPSGRGWLTRGVAGIGAASLLSDLGHEIPTSLLPRLLTSTLGAPAAALGLIEGIADGLAGIARLLGGALADDPRRRRATAVGGYTSTAVLSGVIGLAGAVWQVGALRVGAWISRGLRVPSRNALLADVVAPQVYGRAYGFERAMDNLGAIGGPLLALGLVAVFSVRTAILVSIVPGLLSVVAIAYAIGSTSTPTATATAIERRPLRVRIRPVLRGELRPVMFAVAAFELGNVAATLLILRATELLTPARGIGSATTTALLLYTAYNATAAVTSVPAGRWSDARGTRRVLTSGAVAFVLAYLGFALATASVALLAACFLAAGMGIGCVETAEHAAIATYTPEPIRGSAFGLLAAIQSFGNLAASGVAGILWSVASPRAAFLYLAGWMAVAAIALASLRRPGDRDPR